MLLIAALGGAASGYFLNVEYGPRTSLHPLRVGSRPTFTVNVRRMTFIPAAADTPPPVRRGVPGIIDITPPEAMAVIDSRVPAPLDGGTRDGLAQ